MGGSNPMLDASNYGNQLSAASLAESKRQYNEQKAEKDAKAASAKANAGSNLAGSNMAYSNMVGSATNLSKGAMGNYSLLNQGGYLGSTGDNLTNKLGG